jgi:predicted DCC family thiol-disulfide oxidoreductase YuxK
VKSVLQVASPPAKPLMIFDGNCGFCSLWIRRWRHATGDHVDYLPSQDPRIGAQFPEVPRERFAAAVQLIETDGSVYGGAEAVFRALACNSHDHWLLDWYRNSPGFAHVTEWGYGIVAGHRTLFSILTRLAWGRHVEPPSQILVRWVFLRSIGIIYLVAFVSLWVQIIGLVGSNGILPAKATMEALKRQVDAQRIGWERYHVFPTLCWFDSSDRFLKVQCAVGAGLALLLIVGIAPAPCLFLLWLVYLSLSTVCREFLSFQWDILLLQVGFLSIFFAPLQLLPGWRREAPPSRLMLWLLRCLLFQLMFESGCVKLVSRDPAWRDLTALTFHYETQPLPTWIGWYAHQLPVWAQKASTVFMFGIEMIVPFLIFAPRRLRHFACFALALLQVLILLTGNYCFFNLLTLALCLLLLDDAAPSSVLPSRLRSAFAPPSASIANPTDGNREKSGRGVPTPGRWKWPLPVTIPLAFITLAISLLQISAMFGLSLMWPGPLVGVYQWLAPFRTFNHYGLFAVMTTSRPEIIIEGSNDGLTWQEYEFKYKPGDLKRRPRFVEPHQPRLDWQMWFAALSDYRRNPWLVNFCVRLLQGSPEVLSLLERNPFANGPPRYVRARLYDYHFTDFSTRRKTGAWWRRELKGEYLPVISLREEETRRPKSSVRIPKPIRNPIAATVMNRRVTPLSLPL